MFNKDFVQIVFVIISLLFFSLHRFCFLNIIDNKLK